MRFRSIAAAAALATVLSSAAAAQEWRGKGRVDGVVKNEKGEPVAGCVVKLRWSKSSRGGPDVTTDKNGKWAIFGLASGPWDIDFEFPGYRPRQIQIPIQESGRNETVQTVLEAAAQAAPAVGQPAAPQIMVGGQKISPETAKAIETGNAAMAAKDWPSARASYVTALAELPDNGALLQRVAVAYLGEGNKDEALRYARMASEKAPQDSGPWQIIAELEIEKGNAEAGLAALDKVPAERIVDTALVMNAGIILYNAGARAKGAEQTAKLAQAEAAFDRAIAVSPDASAYYYRGLTRLHEKKNADARADFQKALELDPDGPDAKDIKDILKSIR